MCAALPRLLLAIFALSACSFMASGQTTGPVIIPVAFHILHLGGSENISDAQVMDAVRILNLDYNRLNVDTADIIPAFRNNVANMQVTFRLANLDPNGNCTNGIEHIYSSQTNIGGPALLPGHEWPRDKYLNIWVYKQFELIRGAEGYAMEPWNADTLPSEDGVNIINSFVGSIGTGANLTRNGLTEVSAQCFGLLAIFQGYYSQCLDLDSVADTPPELSPVEYCEDTVFSCDTPLLENTQNFMNYNSCSLMFTNGQKARLYSYLNRGTAQRNNLWTTPNLVATGTNDSTPTPCAPIADFSALKRFVCLGQSVEFEDDSYNDTITGRLWTFNHANITTDTSRLVTVIFDSTGWQTVTVRVMNNQGSSTITKTLVYVADPAAQIVAPYFTGFEDTAAVTQNWISFNIDGDAPAFHPVSNAGYHGNSSILLNNFNSAVYWNEDDLISPAFDCSALSTANANLSFWLSSATQQFPLSSNILDSFSIAASINCGSTWTQIYKLGGANLMNAGSDPNYFVPSSAGQWSKITIPLDTNYLVQNVRFKISAFGSPFSNNLYIDDFNIGDAATAIDETIENVLTVFPNPFNGQVVIRGLAAAKYQIAVLDVTGRVILNYPDLTPAMDGSAAIDLSAISSSGVYFIRISNSSTMATLKIAKA